ncbi:hypothetical protein [Kitasatospora sp. NBC_01302]|nr:hypothetical protein OG294_14230 [Kitasatospora sp. NBC_01302]
MDATFHPTDEPNGRPATDQEITDLLGGMTALDGTNYLDIYEQCVREGWE